MGEESFSQVEGVDLATHQRSNRGREGKAENRLIWEMPLGTKRGYLDEPGPRFVDVEGEADKEACRWERTET